MIDRINLLLKAKNISARQFAEEIGIQPSGMSHILSGRNNPSLDFVMKVVRRWPEVNINWLMFGKGEMFAGAPLNVAPVAPTPVTPTPVATPMPAAPSTPQQRREAEPDLFSQPEEIVEQPPVEVPQYVAPAVPQPQPQSQPQPQPQPQPVVAPIVEPQPQIHPSIQPQPQPKVQVQENRINEIAEAVVEPQPIVAKQKKMVKMIIVYDDHTFSEYYPE